MIERNVITNNDNAASRRRPSREDPDYPFGLPGELVVSIPDDPPFFSLYADGPLSRKTYLRDEHMTLLAFPPAAPVILYYTYPTHRAASLVRNVPGPAALPGLSKNVLLLFSVHASRVDKLRRAAAFLHKNAGGPFRFTDGFYLRLSLILRQRGKLNYPALKKCADTITTAQEEDRERTL